jgi:hypothetical protein
MRFIARHDKLYFATPRLLLQAFCAAAAEFSGIFSVSGRDIPL